MQTVLRNLAVGAMLFSIAVALDYAEITTDSVDLEMLVLLPLSILMYVAVPLSFWWANRGVFHGRKHGEFLRVCLALVLSVIFAAVAFPPFLELHARMGGTL